MIKPASCFLILLALSSSAAVAQVDATDYSRAEMYLPGNIDELVFGTSLSAEWIDEGSKFWFREDTRDSRRFMMVEPDKDRVEPAFDHEALARSLAEATEEEVDPLQLPFDWFEQSGSTIEFSAFGTDWRFEDGQCTKIEEDEESQPGLVSPDGKLSVLVRDHDLWITDLESGEETRLTDDGSAKHAWGQPLPNARDLIAQQSAEITQDFHGWWLDDSRTLVTIRIDAREAGQFTMVQAVPPEGDRMKAFTYAYPLPGEDTVPTAEIVIFDALTGERVTSDCPPQPILYYGSPWLWVEEHGGIYVWDFDRGNTAIRFREVDPVTGHARIILEEEAPTSVIDVGPLDVQFLDEGRQFVWLSERDGWNHAYLYETATGELVRQLTSGDWFFRYVVSIDEENRELYFVGAGREPDRDPYLRHFYRVSLDGGEPVLLTAEPLEHTVDVSPDHEYFVDTMSLVDRAPVTLLRSTKDGDVVRVLQQADIEDLLATGWQYPEPFTAKARDGETDIYGVIWRPSDFDPSVAYPVLNKIYTGPHNFFTPKGFWAHRDVAQSMAEVGFIVIAVDGLGTGKRSKAFHDYSYKNLGTGGHPDHITAIQQLAETRPWMDVDRVGIYGFSAGGYDAARALFLYPDFYKAAVAASGNHDHRMDKAWWNEIWMGYPAGPEYEEQTNLSLAANLEGALFLAHGELDENVHPYSTMRLVDALIEADKDFDLLIMPNKSHYLWDDPYFIRRQWDFFVRHLWDVDPPSGYRIGDDD